MDSQPRKYPFESLGRRFRVCAIAVLLAGVVAPCAAQGLTRIQLNPTGLGRYGDDMGRSVALAGDTAVVGAPNTQLAPAFNSGVVDVYRQQDVAWQPEGILVADDASPGMAFGSAVAVGQDLIVVGAGGVGSIYTYERDGTSWAQVDKLTTSVSSDIGLSGDTLASAGLVYVRAGTGWELQTQLTGDGDPNETFGNSIAIDGDRLAALSYTVSTPSFTFQQYVYFFSRSGTVWTREGKFDLGLTSYPASHVAIQGQTAIVSVYTTGLGTVRAYDRDAMGVWSDRGILDAGTDLLGEVPVSLDGDRLLAGSTGDGTAYTFVRSGDTWTRDLHFNDPTYFGCFTSVALSGSTVLAGCPGGITPSGGYGKADVFSLDSNPPPIIAQFDQGNARADEGFGQGVMLSGSTLLAGARGAAYVLEGSGGNWVEQARLMPAANLATEIAIPLALDSDTAAVGYGGTPGTVDLYVRAGNAWELQESLHGSGSGYNYFGWSAALQGDTLAVGEPSTVNEVFTEVAGASHVFVRAGSSWTEQALIEPLDGSPGDEFGFATSLSGDTLLIGAPRSDTGIETHAGAVYVYVRSGEEWTQEARLLAPVVASHAGFGISVAIKGNTAVIGANNKDLPSESTRGAAYVYRRSGDIWVWQGTLIPPIAPTPVDFGRSVAISETEDKILVSSVYGLRDGSQAGLVFAFAFDGAQWVPSSTLQGSPPFPPSSYDYFGTSVTFSGNDFAIGATNDGIGGAVYLGTLSDDIFLSGFESPP